ncbi:MAG: DUF882 domain-containing protein [Acidobacteriota bacterium]|nr:DUF882 domain-containing protein [Acidobacteriota bacterium]
MPEDQNPTQDQEVAASAAPGTAAAGPVAPSAAAPVAATPAAAKPVQVAASAPVSASASASSSADKPYRLRLANMHTGETLDLVYRVGNVYVPEALERLNSFLRDHYTQDVIPYDPKEFDVLHALMSRLRKPDGIIDVMCGYRTPETNEALRENSPSTGVAEHSQHMEGHAIDLRVPGVSTIAVRNAALSLHAGGVGYYPVSQFVHVDVGPVREWAHGRSPRRTAHHSRSHSSHSSSTAGM